MSLLSTDIAKVKRLSIREVKLPAPEVREVETIKPIQVGKPPTEEEIAYSKLVAINPLIEELVERLDLVSIKTGERIRKVEVREDYSPHPELEMKAQEVDSSKLITLAGKIIKGENSYSKEDIIARIKEATNVSQERAERGFLLMLLEGAIAQTINPEFYYLGGSTPF
jgi:hypothetical protein